MTDTSALIAAAAAILDGFPEQGRDLYVVDIRPGMSEVGVIVSGDLTEDSGRDLLGAIGVGTANLSTPYGPEDEPQARLTGLMPDSGVRVTLIVTVLDTEPAAVQDGGPTS